MLDFDSGGQSFINGWLSSPLISGCRPNHSQRIFFPVNPVEAAKRSSRIRSCGDCKECADAGALRCSPLDRVASRRRLKTERKMMKLKAPFGRETRFDQPM